MQGQVEPVIDIEKEVMDKYPILADEKGCRILRDRRNGLRAEYRNRLQQMKTGVETPVCVIINHPMKTEAKLS